MSTFRLGHAVPHTLTRSLVIAIALMLATPTFAADFIIVDGQTETSQGVLNGAANKTGIIEAGGTLTTTVDAISVSGTDSSTVTNSGTINANGEFSDGIVSQGTNTIITNSGTINADDVGIRVFNTNSTNAIITNSGNINATDVGIFLGSDSHNAVITNSGNITSTTNDGIYALGDDAIITNSGNITGADDGIDSRGDNAIITNSGNITGAIDGIDSRGTNAIITNSGSITSTTDDGIDSGGAGSIITNSGHITGTDHAVRGGSTDSLTLNLLKGSQLMGKIDLNGAGDNDTVNIHGGSVSATLTFLNTENINLLGPGLKLSGDVVAVSVDGTAEAARSVVLSTITSDIHDQIAQRTYLPAAPQPVKAAPSTVLPGLQFKQHKPVAWIQVLGGDSDRDAEDNARAYEHDYVGINGGYEWDLGQRRVGLVGGVVNSDTDGNENSFKSDTEHFYLGAYTSQQLQGFTLTTSLLGGYGRHDNERLVIDNLNGREVAKSDFSSLFISPSVTIASAYKIYDRIELRPSASVNYSIAWLDDHSERGTTQSNLSVDDRQIQALSTKLQIAAAYAYSATSEFELRTGINSRYTDDDDTEISIGGSKSKFSNVGDENVYSSFVGARIRIASSDKLSLVADVELGGNGDEDYKAGHLSVEYTFH